jgi:parvulin-like peptidyl-prolyl isomerase
MLSIQSCTRQPDAFLARVGEERLTEEAFRAEVLRRGVGTEEGKRALLDEMVRELKLVHYARQKGYDRDAEMERELRALLMARAKRDFGFGADGKEPGFAESELRTQYAAHRQEFAVPTRVRAAMIFVATPAGLNAGALAAKRKKIEDARTAITAATLPPTAPFGAVAQRFSEDQATRYVGGDLGYQVEGMASFTADAAAHAALFGLRESGSLSEVVTTASGFYLFKLLERTPGDIRPFEAVRGRLVAKLREAKRQEREKKFADALGAITGETRTERLATIPVHHARLASHSAATPPAVPGGADQPETSTK